MAFIQKQFSLNRKLYVAFIDNEKAFDSVNRSILWSTLLKNGINGKLYKSIMSMYECVKARVRCGSALTEYINCTSGVKQGDICSPVLFSLFINELTTEVIDAGRHGASFSKELLDIFILLLAADVVLIAETVVGLQNQLNILKRASSSLQLKVNLTKSNITVFRKGGYLAATERWFYDGSELAVVNVYKYLGIYFSTRLSFTYSCKCLTSKAKSTLLYVVRKLSLLQNDSLKLLLKIFDIQIQPIFQYGAEIWGLDAAAVQCDKFHQYALKKCLGVSLQTQNDIVYGETDRYPVSLTSAVKCIQYWLKLTRMNNERLPSKAYRMLDDLDERGKNNWVSNVRTKLFTYGFGNVWLSQGVGDSKSFIRCFRERLIDSRWQDWNKHVQTSDRFDLYRLINERHCLPSYISIDLNRRLKIPTTKFRFGVSDIAVHRLRFRHLDDCNLISPLCKGNREDEMHFVLVCPVLRDIREQFIPSKYFNTPSLFKLIMLKSSRHKHTVRQLTLYLHYAFKRRNVYMS